MMDDLTQLSWLVNLNLHVKPIEASTKKNSTSALQQSLPKTAPQKVKKTLRKRKKQVSYGELDLCDDPELSMIVEQALRNGQSSPPRHSISSLIAFALLSSKKSKGLGLSCLNITRWIQRNFPLIDFNANELKSAVRSELTTNRFFSRKQHAKTKRHTTTWSIMPSKYESLKESLAFEEMEDTAPTRKRTCRKSFGSRLAIASSSSEGCDSAATDDSELDLEDLFESVADANEESMIQQITFDLMEEASSTSSSDHESLANPPEWIPSLYMDDAIDCTLPNAEVDVTSIFQVPSSSSFALLDSLNL